MLNTSRRKTGLIMYVLGRLLEQSFIKPVFLYFIDLFWSEKQVVLLLVAFDILCHWLDVRILQQ